MVSRDLSAVSLAIEQLEQGKKEIDNNDPEYYMQREPAAHAAIVPVKGRSEVPKFPHPIGVHIVQRTVQTPRPVTPRRGFAALVR